MERNIFYRRNLPHIHPQDALFFITFRLHGSLPAHIIEQLRTEYLAEERRLKTQYQGGTWLAQRHKMQEKHFGKYDDYLDECSHGPVWLSDPRIAEIVAEEIKRLDNVRYRLICYCIMPNHVHLLIDCAGFWDRPSSQHGGKIPYPLSYTMQLLKGRTARLANQVLQRSGKFWQDESYDHFIRNEVELARLIAYILNNPVRAGRVEDWRDWPFTYLSPDWNPG